MKHLRLDWQGIQDLRQTVLEDLVEIEDMLDEGHEASARTGLTEIIDGLGRLSGSPEDAVDNRAFPDGSSIQDDEPVFLLRAKDAVSSGAVRDWAIRAERAGADRTLVERVFRWADEMDAYAWTKRMAGEWGPLHAPDAPALREDPAPGPPVGRA